jgi:hypothetical protein
MRIKMVIFTTIIVKYLVVWEDNELPLELPRYFRDV